MHPKDTKAKMKADFCEGKFPSMDAMCKHYGVPPDTANKWRREDKWQESRVLVLEMKREKTLEAVSDRLSKEDQRAFEVSGGILGLTGQKVMLVAEDLKDHTGEAAEDRSKRIRPAELAMMASTVERCHKTQRLAVGADSQTPERMKIDIPDIRAQLQDARDSGILPRANLPKNGNGGSN